MRTQLKDQTLEKSEDDQEEESFPNQLELQPPSQSNKRKSSLEEGLSPDNRTRPRYSDAVVASAVV